MTTRKLIIYGGVILLSLTTIFAVIANNGSFKAQVALEEPCIAETDVNGDGLVNTDDCTGGGGGTGVEPCDDVVADTQNVTLTTPIKCEPPVCEEGSPPSDVPGSVRQSRDAADQTAAATQPEVTAVAEATKADIETGTIKAAIEQAGQKVYDDENHAKREMQKVWDTKVLPNIRLQYYELGWTKVSNRTTTSGNQAKGFFGTQYSKDPDRWGPQVTGEYTFLRSGNANITGRARIGGFTYNGQSLGSGFADFSLRGTWNILGDTLQAIAAYDCEVGNASGSTSVKGKWTNIGVQANIPVYIKTGKNSAIKITLSFGYNFVDKQLGVPGSSNWPF